MQLCQSPAISEAATKLFLKEWANDQDNDVVDFIDYFKKELLDMNSNWFEGYNYNHQENRGSPSTNNGNESINAATQHLQLIMISSVAVAHINSAAIISSHINEEANTPSTSSNIAPNKRGRKSFSAEVRLQKAEEKLAQKNAKKQKKLTVI